MTTVYPTRQAMSLGGQSRSRAKLRQLARARAARGIARIQRTPPKGWPSVEALLAEARTICVANRLTGKLAAHCSVSKWVVRRWLSGAKTPVQYRLEQLAKFLRVEKRKMKASTALVLGRKN
jgi:hypothetical protein